MEKQFIDTYTPLYQGLTIKKSKVHGLGLFAEIDFPAGVDFGETHVFVVNKNRRDWVRTPLGGFINHEPLVYNNMEEKKELSGPNCEKIKSRPDGAKTEWNLVTRKDIKSGEELTVHYTFYKPE